MSLDPIGQPVLALWQVRCIYHKGINLQATGSQFQQLFGNIQSELMLLEDLFEGSDSYIGRLVLIQLSVQIVDFGCPLFRWNRFNRLNGLLRLIHLGQAFRYLELEFAIIGKGGCDWFPGAQESFGRQGFPKETLCLLILILDEVGLRHEAQRLKIFEIR